MEAGHLEPDAQLSAVERLLAGRPLTTARWGLERIQAMLVGLGRPDRTFDSLHIAGTNGKGSTATVAASILTAAGRRTGLYTSPHLVDVRERFQADGAPVPDEILNQCADQLLPFAEQTGATFFEATTALAFLCFAELELEWAVVETGLGGRLDATNVLQPIVCAITQIDVDHTDFLGPTLGEIAGEKAGIMKPGVPTVTPALSHELRRIFEQQALLLSTPLLSLGRHAHVEDVSVSREVTSFRYRSNRFDPGLSLRSPLIGRHQAVNAALAVLMLEQAVEGLDADHVRIGVEEARLAGRLQRLEIDGQEWILDIAHNLAGVEALLVTVVDLSPPKPWMFLVAILRDKPWQRMVQKIAEAADAMILTVAPSAPADRRWDFEDVQDWAASTISGLPGARSFELEPNMDLAIDRAGELSGEGTVIVTGSAHTVGDVLTRLEDRAVPE
jgi:dihydrofolate synthase/folylpolyglutamate synthase